jgi:hypothetical protein
MFIMENVFNLLLTSSPVIVRLREVIIISKTLLTSFASHLLQQELNNNEG